MDNGFGAGSTQGSGCKKVAQMQCPRCSGRRLKLGVVFSGELECSFREGSVVEIVQSPALESRWDDQSPCRCTACGWKGRVKDLQLLPVADAKRPRKIRRLTSESLKQIADQASTDLCPRSIREDVSVLLKAIHQLNKQVQILESVARARSRGQEFLDHDTAIF